MGLRPRVRTPEERERRAAHAALKAALTNSDDPVQQGSEKPVNGGYTPADAATKKAVIARDGACLKCGRGDTLTPSHFVSRRIQEYRHDLRNVCALCIRCHMDVEARRAGCEQWRVATWEADAWIAAGGVNQLRS